MGILRWLSDRPNIFPDKFIQVFRMYVDDEDDFDLEDEVESEETEESKKKEKKKEDNKENDKKDSDQNPKRKLLKKFIKILVIIICIFLGSWWAAYSKTRAAHKKDNYMADEMEKMYAKGDYQEMTDYYFERVADLGDKKYAKYKRIAELYDEYLTADEYIRDAYNKVVGGDSTGSGYAWEMKQLFRVILLCDMYREEGYPYGEEQGVTDIREKVVNYLQGVLLLDKISIEQVASMYLEAKDSDSIDKVMDLIDGFAAASIKNVLE